MKRLALLAAAALIAASPAWSQQAPETATITAEGEGVVFAEPDLVVVTIGVTTRDEDPSEALAANSADIQAVIDSIAAAGIDPADMTTSGFSIGPVYGERSREDGLQPIIGYSVSNQLTVRIRDFDATGGILDQVVQAGANQISGIRFDIAEPQPLQDEAIALAIADALRKAELMAEAAGVEIVRVLSVSSYGSGRPQFELARVANAVPIVGGEQAISATATVVFEIAPAE